MIKNIVFDIGNVILKWQPKTVVDKHFPNEDTDKLTQALFKSEIWYDLNLGKMTESEAIQIYHRILGIDQETLNILMQDIKASLLPIDHSFDLLNYLYQAKFSLYALTDNVPEIIAYLKAKYDFWNKFKGIVVSAEIGHLKPAPEIYEYLMSTYNIKPSESVFIDDHMPNVDGAKAVGMNAIQFVNIGQCINELNKLGVRVKLERKGF